MVALVASLTPIKVCVNAAPSDAGLTGLDVWIAASPFHSEATGGASVHG